MTSEPTVPPPLMQGIDQIRKLGTKMMITNLLAMRDDQVSTYHDDVREAIAPLCTPEVLHLVERLGALTAIAAKAHASALVSDATRAREE